MTFLLKKHSRPFGAFLTQTRYRGSVHHGPRDRSCIDIPNMSRHRGLLPLVCDLGTPWQAPRNPVQDGVRESLQLRDSHKWDDLTDCTFAELDRRVGRAGFAPG